MSGKEEAMVILQQMGGAGRLQAFVGGHDFICKEEGTLQFIFKLCSKANMFEIRLDCTDTYSMTFYQNGVNGRQEVESFTSLYNDQLQSVFEDFTGLYLSL
ncbi:MAG TPA: hypothetical protein VNM45_09135 [Bacillus sp. (in: firmicutes)]|nr:hypothetical protein [Bacillus sp. (in: firmicutes)]